MQTLLLLHGALGAKDHFEPLLPLLAGFDARAMDFSGHGQSAMPDDFSIPLFAGDILAYLDRHGIAKTDIFGYSMGGYVALYLARHHPGRVGKILTLGTKFDWSPGAAAREAKMLDAGKIAEKVPAFAAQLERRHLDWRSLLSKTAAMMEALGRENPLKPADLETIANDVTIALGDRDAMVSLEETVAVYQKLPNAKLLVVPGTPHPIEKVAMRRLAYEITQFFAP
jgi:pimeloyl-ACP methyl ester carboxylesterase